MSILITNGEVVTASDRFQADVLIEGDKVVALGRDLPRDGKQVFDASGKYVLPGFIDVHVHLALPFMGTVSKDDFVSGTRCALAGGTTSLIDFCIPARGQSLRQALEVWDAKAQGKALIDYSYHMAITDWNEEIRQELDMVFERGITSFKIFMAYKGVLMVTDDQIFELMGEVRKRGGLVTAHAVNGDVQAALSKQLAAEGKLSPRYHPAAQPSWAEGEASERFLTLGHLAGQPAYIVHMTCKEAVDALERARHLGWASFGEVCAQHLVLDDSLYELPDFEGGKYVMSPPLRKKHDQEALWNALDKGIIQVVGTDHCTFDFKGQKDMGRHDFRLIPNGLNGLEERVNLLHTRGVLEGRITLNRWVEVAATNPAKMFGLYPQKGHLSPGADADVVIYDPTLRHTVSASHHQSAADYNVYEGMQMVGRPTHVFVRGVLSYENGKVLASPGQGKFLSRQPGGPLLEPRVVSPAQPVTA
ncbi:MAG TPA: dihydropyrimidinase [Candidatus Nitrosotenuis sp.]|jgi:dihydropyrimidinase|nr:dihydropyrimidinase [Candidatus Nitrosotenuis sp.]